MASANGQTESATTKAHKASVEARHGDAAVAVALLTLAVYVIWTAQAMPVGSIASPGPGFFPLGLGIALAATSLGLLLRSRIIAGDRSSVELMHASVGAAFVILMGVAFFFDLLGALPTLALMLAILSRTFAPIAWWKAALFGIAGAFAAWIFFVRLLGVSLPGA